MKTTSLLVVGLSFAASLAGCSKSPAPATAQDTGPDNAFTRYGERLAQSERQAQETVNRANAVTAQQQEQMKQGMKQESQAGQ